VRDVTIAGGRVRAAPSRLLSEGSICDGTSRANDCGWAREHETVWVLDVALRVETCFISRDAG
jgi:hypothetical protein